VRAAAHSLDIALQPSPLLGRGARLFCGVQLLHALELALRGHPLAALAMFGTGAVCLIWLRSTWRSPAQGARRLLLLADGRALLLTVAGEVQPVALSASSLRLGAWLLLVLHGPRVCYRLLLGPDNLEAASLSALRRRLVAAGQKPLSVLYADLSAMGSGTDAARQHPGVVGRFPATRDGGLR
jgi:hypothetical protein